MPNFVNLVGLTKFATITLYSTSFYMYAELHNTAFMKTQNAQLLVHIHIHIKIYTALRHRTYNQAVKVSACEGIDRYMYT